MRSAGGLDALGMRLGVHYARSLSLSVPVRFSIARPVVRSSGRKLEQVQRALPEHYVRLAMAPRRRCIRVEYVGISLSTGSVVPASAL